MEVSNSMWYAMRGSESQQGPRNVKRKLRLLWTFAGVPWEKIRMRALRIAHCALR